MLVKGSTTYTYPPTLPSYREKVRRKACAPVLRQTVWGKKRSLVVLDVLDRIMRGRRANEYVKHAALEQQLAEKNTTPYARQTNASFRQATQVVS